MGYTHYIRRPLEVPQEEFTAIATDFSEVVAELAKHGLRLAGGAGTGIPEIDRDAIVFNGVEKCGHKDVDLGIAWPASKARGQSAEAELQVKGSWFAGALLAKRTCGGDCSHETFCFERILEPESWHHPENGLYLEFCKTAFKPYDLAVTACLMIIKHRLGETVEISTDGDDENWAEARNCVFHLLGYGQDLHINHENRLVSIERR